MVIDYSFKEVFKALKCKGVWRWILDCWFETTIIFLLCLLPFAYHYEIQAQMILSGTITTADDCSGDLKFSWHMENTDVTLGTPAGCSDGDETATASGSPSISSAQKQDGTSSVLFGSADYYKFDIVSDDLINDAEGKIEFYLYVDTFITNCVVFRPRYTSSGNDLLEVKLINDAANIDVQFTFKANGNSDWCTVNSNFGEDTWVKIIYQWKESETAADHKCTANSVEQGPEDDIEASANAWNELHIGNPPAVACLAYIDNLQIYATSGL